MYHTYSPALFTILSAVSRRNSLRFFTSFSFGLFLLFFCWHVGYLCALLSQFLKNTTTSLVTASVSLSMHFRILFFFFFCSLLFLISNAAKSLPFWLFVSLTSLYPLAIKRCTLKKRAKRSFYYLRQNQYENSADSDQLAAFVCAYKILQQPRGGDWHKFNTFSNCFS